MSDRPNRKHHESVLLRKTPGIAVLAAALAAIPGSASAQETSGGNNARQAASVAPWIGEDPALVLRFEPASTARLEQVIGDEDRPGKHPNEARTLSRYGLKGTDLGSSFRHGNRIVFLFGDCLPDGDAVGYTESLRPRDGAPLGLRFFTRPGGSYFRLRPEGVPTGGFCVPTGGVSLNGQAWVWYKTDWDEASARNSSVLLECDFEARKVRVARRFSPLGGKFIEVAPRRAEGKVAGLPPFADPVFLWGTGETYRAGELYLAVADGERIGEARSVLYFAGLDGEGRPRWGQSEDGAVSLLPGLKTFGEISVAWNADCRLWLLAYSGNMPERGVKVMAARQPWGPWSEPVMIFEPGRDKAYENYFHRQGAADGLAGPVIDPGEDPRQVWGGEYAPMLIEDHCSYADGVLTLRYLLSAWNPYTVYLMESRVATASPAQIPPRCKP